MMVCMGHLYGVVLYFATSTAEQYYHGSNGHSRPEFQYFWLYYVGFNLPWVIVPAREFSSSISSRDTIRVVWKSES